MKVPDAYYQFIIDYAPYIYVIPPDTPDPTWGRAAFTVAFAIDFLYQAYYDSEFASKQADIYNKIVSLANWILTQPKHFPFQMKAFIFEPYPKPNPQSYVYALMLSNHLLNASTN